MVVGLGHEAGRQLEVEAEDDVVAQTLRPFAEITQRAGRPRTRGEIGGDARLLLRLLHDILPQAQAVGLTAGPPLVAPSGPPHLLLCPPADPHPPPVPRPPAPVHVNAHIPPPHTAPPPP